MVKEKSCGNCARGDCPLTGLVESCIDWCSDEDAPTAAEVAADLAPLAHAECAARGIRHSSEDAPADAVVMLRKLIDSSTEYARHFGKPREDNGNLRAFFRLGDAVRDAREFIKRIDL